MGPSRTPTQNTAGDGFPADPIDGTGADPPLGGELRAEQIVRPDGRRPRYCTGHCVNGHPGWACSVSSGVSGRQPVMS
jgi:hypothetical protein